MNMRIVALMVMAMAAVQGLAQTQSYTRAASEKYVDARFSALSNAPAAKITGVDTQLWNWAANSWSNSVARKVSASDTNAWTATARAWNEFVETPAFTDPVTMSSVTDVVDAAIGRIPQPTGARFWVSDDGTAFATVEPGPVFTAWLTTSSFTGTWTVPPAGAGRIDASALTYPLQQGFHGDWTIGLNPAESYDVSYVPSDTWNGIAATLDSTSIVLYLAPWCDESVTISAAVTVSTNLVSSFVLLRDMTNFLARADWISGSNALALAAASAQVTADEAWLASDSAYTLANQVTISVGSIQQQIDGEGGLADQIDGKADASALSLKVNVTDGVLTNPAVSGTVTVNGRVVESATRALVASASVTWLWTGTLAQYSALTNAVGAFTNTLYFIKE